MAGTRYSKQRELIFNAVRDMRTHPTAEMVYTALKGDHPNLSLGTVYRNLSLLASEGKLVRLPFPVERYDGLLHPHGHFCCERCGSVSDVDLPNDMGLEGAASDLGHQVNRHTIVFYGLCADCAGTEEK